MIDVVPLRYGTIFKKAFSDPEVFSAFVRDVVGVELEFSRVEQEKSFRPIVGQVDIRFDLYGEDPKNRAIVELQHVREVDVFPRFHYYHLVAQVQQVTSSRSYQMPQTVYTIVVLTRLPKEEHLRFDVASQSSDIVTHDGRPLGLFGHKIIFVNPRAVRPTTPPALRKWLELFEDSLDTYVDESVFPDPLFQRVIHTIEATKLSPEERYWMKEEAIWEDTKDETFREGEQKGFDKGRTEGRKEGLTEGRTEAIVDLCDVFDIVIDDERKAWLESLDVDALDALRAQIKKTKRWPV